MGNVAHRLPVVQTRLLVGVVQRGITAPPRSSTAPGLGVDKVESD